MNGSQSKTLYWIAGVLIALRFGVVPWIEWQSERRDGLVVLTKRLDRSVGVIENRSAIEESARDLDASLAATRPKFRQAESLEGFKLAAQQELTAVVTQAGLRVAVFDWVVDKFDDPAPLMRARARLQIGGTVPALAAVEGKLEAQFPSLSVREVRLDAQNANNTPFTTQANLTLVADFYFRKAEGAQP